LRETPISRAYRSNSTNSFPPIDPSWLLLILAPLMLCLKEGFMKARITVITLGVDDLEKSLQFYRDLGLKTEGIIGKEFEHGAVAFFKLQAGLNLAIWPRKRRNQGQI